MKGVILQKHRLRLVLFCVVWIGYGVAFGQQTARTLFPQMPGQQSFAPIIIEGQLPESSGVAVTDSEVRVRPKPLRRNGKTYWEIDLYYDNKINQTLFLRQQGDTVWLALDAWEKGWKAKAAAKRLPGFQEGIRDAHDREPAWMPLPPASMEEEVLLRFDAQAGTEWTSFETTQGLISFYRVKLEKVMAQDGDQLFVFAISTSLHASHMPQLMKLVVSKTRGIRGMLWYDYACWNTPRYDCEDLLVRYGSWE